MVKESVVACRVSPADLKLLRAAAKLANLPLSTWGRGVMVLMAIWQTDGEVKLAPEHDVMIRTLEKMGMTRAIKVGRRRAA